MLVLRLQRTGRKNLPTYRIVAADKSRPVQGKFQDILGHYLPAQKNPVFQVDTEKVEAWIKKGAIPSDTLARLLKREGVKGMEKYIASYSKKRAKNAPDEPEAPAAPAAAPEAAAEPTEAPKEEPVAEEAPKEEPAPTVEEKPAEKEASEATEVTADKKEESAEEPKKEEAPAAEEGDKA